MNTPLKNDALKTETRAVVRTETIISRLLRTGVIVSLLTIFLGVVLMFAHHHDYLRSRADLKQLTTPGTAFPQTLAEVAEDLLAFRGQAVVAGGLLMLIATPIFRVAVSIAAFVLQRDLTYVLITTGVLLVLVLSFFLGKAG
jgi:uncharacterized membrane protein